MQRYALGFVYIAANLEHKRMDKRYLRSVRLLAECMQLFEKRSSANVRRCGLTESQFDIIATLGNTDGMSCKELGDNTLITKGTLTGVLDRLEQKALISRCRGGGDKRQMLVKLTDAGDAVFQTAFPNVVTEGQRLFDDYAEEDFAQLERELQKLKTALSKRL